MWFVLTLFGRSAIMSETTQQIEQSPLHAYMFTRFREAFGQPQNTLQKDDHWAFCGIAPGSKSINVLVNGTPASPAVWVFDPNELANPVYSTAIGDELQVDQVIVLIQTRIGRASQPC
jgi:hypothetical protein